MQSNSYTDIGINRINTLTEYPKALKIQCIAPIFADCHSLCFRICRLWCIPQVLIFVLPKQKMGATPLIKINAVLQKKYPPTLQGFVWRKQVKLLLKAKHMFSSCNENEGLYYLHALLFHSCHTGLFHQHLHCYLQDKRNKSKYGPFSGNSNFETSQGSMSPNIEKWRYMDYARNFNFI